MMDSRATFGRAGIHQIAAGAQRRLCKGSRLRKHWEALSARVLAPIEPSFPCGKTWL